jgi:hypothetical protein
MDRFTKSIKQSLRDKNWYAALALSLAIPDISANIENPEAGSKARYVDWYNRFVKKKYTGHVGPDREEHIFLCGEDCYALRCSLLHEGSNDITEQRAQEVLNKFHFVVPPKNGNVIHMNQYGNALQLQIDVFCEDICNAVSRWLETEVAGNKVYQSRIASLFSIYENKERTRKGVGSQLLT